MKRFLSCIVVFLIPTISLSADLSISSKEPVIAVAPDHWQAALEKAPAKEFPFETYRVSPPEGRNAACLITILEKNPKLAGDGAFLKKVLIGDSQPYVQSPDELSKIAVKPLKINGGVGFYANFVDPDLVGKPVKKDEYKTTTPIILGLDKSYVIKATIFCDDLDGADYKDAMKIIESLKVKK